MKMLFILSVLLTFSAQASKNTATPIHALNKLNSSPFITLVVNKKVKSGLVGSETNSPGKIYLAQDRFRWDSEGKESSSLIFDGYYLWTVQQPPKGFKTAPQITKTKIDSGSSNQLLLKSLFQNKLDSQFKIIKTTKEKSGIRFFLKPTAQNQLTHSLELLVLDDDQLSEISYQDEIENRIEISISKTIKSQKIPKKLFQYSPPKGSQVSEI